MIDDSHTKDPTKTKPLLIKVLGAGLLVAVAYGIWTEMRPGGAFNAYSCSNLVPEIVALSADNASALLPTKLAGVLEHRTISSTKDRVECVGTAMLSNGLRGEIKYRAYVEADQWWIVYDPVIPT
ncbi:MAG TPA: hypothetical protein VIL30_04410 [Ramlibacter sp.]